MFGIFNEEIVRKWCAEEFSPYEDVGRPTIKRKGDDTRGSTLDFTFKNKDGKLYIVEMKCELQYEGYKYLELKEPKKKQLDHHNTLRVVLEKGKGC